MTSVELLETQFGRLTVPVGRIDLHVLPAQKEDDFQAVPPGIASGSNEASSAFFLFGCRVCCQMLCLAPRRPSPHLASAYARPSPKEAAPPPSHPLLTTIAPTFSYRSGIGLSQAVPFPQELHGYHVLSA
jgi:hypothetical protein